MPRKITLFTGQWADLPFEKMCEKAKSFGYDGLELACWGDHFDVVKALTEDRYCENRWEILGRHNLDCFAISNHLVGQATLDLIDERHKAILPPEIWGGGGQNEIRARAAERMKDTARACRKFMDAKPLAAKGNLGIVNGFTGSSIWHLLYSFPPASPKMIEKGYEDFMVVWEDILKVYEAENVDFGLEAHPTEIAFDIATAERAVHAVRGHPRFKLNYDPSHLGYQGVDYVKFIRRFANRIAHVHMKDVQWGKGDGTVGIFGGFTKFGDSRRFWDFRSPGRGDIDFEQVICALNDVGYAGPLSVEWEDSRMDREHGATEACAFVRKIDFPRSGVAFDAAFEKKD